MANELDKDVAKVLDRSTGKNARSATLGDSTGTIYEPGRPGYVRVTYPASGGRTFPSVVRLRINIEMTPGTPVIVDYDRSGEPAIVDSDFDGMLAGNWNPYTGQTNNKDTNAVDLNLSPILLCAAFGGSQPLYVKLFPFKYVKDATLHSFAGVSGGIDLSSYIPTNPGEGRVIGIFLTPSDTHEIQASVATSDPVGDDDMQACITAATADALPVAFWRLVYGQTLIADTDKLWDARQWINVPETGTNTDDTGIYIGTWW